MIVTWEATFTCANVGGDKKLNETLLPENHVFAFEENLFPTPAKASSGQMLIQKGFSCSAPALTSFRVLASRSRVLAEQSTETFHQSADEDGSSWIMRAAEPARIRLYSPGSTKANIYTLYTPILTEDYTYQTSVGYSARCACISYQHTSI